MTCDTVSFVQSPGMETAAVHAKLSDLVNQFSPIMKIAVLLWPPVRLLAVELFPVLQKWPTTLHEFLFPLVFCCFVL